MAEENVGQEKPIVSKAASPDIFDDPPIPLEAGCSAAYDSHYGGNARCL